MLISVVTVRLNKPRVAPLTPDFTASISPEYTMGLENGGELRLRADYSFRDDMFGEPTADPGRFTAIDSRGLLNFNVTYTTPSGDWPDDPRLRAPASPTALIGFDRAFFPAPRARFLAAWLSAPGHVVRALVEDGAVTGYGVLRPCREGAKIGPLFAASEADADLLFRALVAEAPPGPVFLDPPEPNAAALRLAGRHGLSPVFETARMYRGPAPELPLHCIFGITSFELG